MVTKMKKLHFLVLIWLFVYPLVLAVNALHRAYASDLPLYVQTASSTLILVPTIVFIIVPTVNKILSLKTRNGDKK